MPLVSFDLNAALFSVVIAPEIVAESALNPPDICKDYTLSSDPMESPIITLPLNSANCITP